MSKRLFPVFTVAVLSAALVVAQEQRPGQTGQPGQQAQPGQPTRPGQPGGQPDRDKAGQPGMTASIDGNWTVVSATRDGRAVDAADKLTVTIKDNVVTFAGGVGGAPDKTMRALRLDFGQHGTLRVTEAGADGKFGAPGGIRPGGDRPGGDRPPAGNPPPDRRPGGDPPAAQAGGATQPGGAAQPDRRPGQPGGDRPGAADRGTMTGVYVLTNDYLAVSVFDAASPGGGIRPGGDRPPVGDRPGADRPGGAGQPGGTTQPATGAGQPGGVGAGQPGGLGAGMGPQTKSHVSVILKRAGGPGRP